MSGYKPIEFVKAAADKETEDSKLPLTEENVMSEKDKVAEALVRGETYDPFGHRGEGGLSLPQCSAYCERHWWRWLEEAGVHGR